jgi:hypothetical protein
MGLLEERIADRSARVAVIGMGYVGFPLAMRVKASSPQSSVLSPFQDLGPLEISHLERSFMLPDLSP